jgi:hypothetical protein
LSGKIDARPDFQRMIKDSSKHLFEVVLVYQFDRFARNKYDSANYKHILKKNGVKVISAKENISEDPNGILMETVLIRNGDNEKLTVEQIIADFNNDNFSFELYQVGAVGEI